MVLFEIAFFLILIGWAVIAYTLKYIKGSVVGVVAMSIPIMFAVLGYQAMPFVAGGNTTIPIYCTNPIMPNTTTVYNYYYMTNTISTFNATDTYYTLNAFPPATLNTIHYTITTNAAHKVTPSNAGHYELAQYVTNATAIVSNIIYPGWYQVQLYATANSQYVQLYSQFWILTPSNNHRFMIGKSDLSQQVQNSTSPGEYTTSFFNNQTIDEHEPYRLAIEVFANLSANTANDVGIYLYMSWINNSHVAIPTTVPCQPYKVLPYSDTSGVPKAYVAILQTAAFFNIWVSSSFFLFSVGSLFWERRKKKMEKMSK